MGFRGFPRYVPKAEKMARAAKKLEKLKKKRDVKPVILQGSAIARTWWGKAWNENLERYADYENRIGRGRSYVRHGAVLDLQIREGEVIALVQGSSPKPYEIVITIKKLNKETWKRIGASCAGMIDSLSELIEGKFPKSMAEIFMRQESGLFPAPKEITLKCSCPDWAVMCKHVAAALYGVGARLDEDPALFFTLRGVDTAGLISRTVASKTESLLEKAGKKSSRILENADLEGMFGIELAGKTTSDAVVLKNRSRAVASPRNTGQQKAGPKKKPTAGQGTGKPRTAVKKKAARKKAKKAKPGR